MMYSENWFKTFFRIWAIWAIISFGCFIGVIAVVIHFLSKWW